MTSVVALHVRKIALTTSATCATAVSRMANRVAVPATRAASARLCARDGARGGREDLLTPRPKILLPSAACM